MRKLFIILALILLNIISCKQKPEENFEFLDTNLPADERVDLLVSQLTVQ